MYNSRPHPLLQQIPLTVSPFVVLPTAPTLPYNYQQMPSTLPPSVLQPPPPPPGDPSAGPSSSASASASASNPQAKPRYVVSSSGHAAHPDEIIASCREMQSHLDAMRRDAERDLAALMDGIRERELAEKRRIAPGWLDSEVRVLQPERTGSASPGAAAAAGGKAPEAPPGTTGAATDQGAELDRAFGTLRVE